MPPALFTRSAHHSVDRNPAAPTGAAMPARMASTPSFTGPAVCAKAGTAPRRAAAAPPITARNCRRVVVIVDLPSQQREGRIIAREPARRMRSDRVVLASRWRSGYSSLMKAATITQAKNQLSALIDRVRHGETIVITD